MLIEFSKIQENVYVKMDSYIQENPANSNAMNYAQNVLGKFLILIKYSIIFFIVIKNKTALHVLVIYNF